MTPAECATVVAALSAGFPNAAWPAATVAIYEAMLADLEVDVARNAIARLIRTSKFRPTIAEILEAAADFSIGPCRNGAEAWADVMLAIRRVGQYGVPEFDDPIVGDVVRIMTWRNLCIGETPEGVDRATFVKLYDERQRRQRQQDVAEPGRLLPGGTGQGQRQLPPNVRELVAGIGPTQPSHGMTGFEKARKL